ncbi:MAG: hypothetical protein A2091_04465 [Desulfuromonadales bacterium GWD2_61_12]|nr:MAG: hypothetical protein A2005_07540 [Desulfuromonadales bacterium GWC2_61_20]OGR34463.1 MAG: hypothetical protein A2091_04465 [Desulfuromonadales bacterium GWD2_61_12]HAD03845.1 hypothetical protein [Desulfuromonas sp.]HBT82200.1 hypothetical protein [Desulfuromonas sp.]
MNTEMLVHTCRIDVAGSEYEVLVYSRLDGIHIAKTYLSPSDVIINDGPSLADALARHTQLLPLALDSRRMLRDYRRNSLN